MNKILSIVTLFIATFVFGQTDASSVSSLTCSTDCELADPESSLDPDGTIADMGKSYVQLNNGIEFTF